MWKVNWQRVRKRPISVYISVAAVIVLDLYLLYFVNLELLPYVFGLDRELYRKTMITLATDTMTTAAGVFVGLLLFGAVKGPVHVPDAAESPAHVPPDGSGRVEGTDDRTGTNGEEGKSDE